MRSNWSSTVDLGGSEARPGSAADVADLVRGDAQVLALGSAHSFSAVAVTPGLHIDTASLPADVRVEGTTASVGAGTTYAALGRELHARGVALAAMASLPHITVGGAIATGTHGSGDAIGTLSSAVTGLEVVTADGEIRWVRRGADPDFAGWVVALGALGVVTRVELEVEPTYDVAQTVFAGLDLDVVEAEFDAVFSAATSVSVFTRWRPEPDAQLWLKRRIDREGAWPGGPAFGVPERQEPLHPLEQLDPVHCNPQSGQPGPWHERLPHFRAEFTPSSSSRSLFRSPQRIAALRALPRQWRASRSLLLRSLLSTTATVADLRRIDDPRLPAAWADVPKRLRSGSSDPVARRER